MADPRRRPSRRKDSTGPNGAARVLVHEVWERLRAQDPAAAEAGARRFVDGQPHLVALAESVMGRFDESALRSGIGLLYLLASVLEARHGAALPPVSRDEAEQARRATLAWLRGWDGRYGGPGAREEARSAELISYLIGAFHGGDTGREEYDAEVRGGLLLTLASAAAAAGAASAAARGRAPRRRRRG